MFIGTGLPITAQRFVGGVVAPAAFDFSLAGGMTFTDLAETTPAVLDDAVASASNGSVSAQQSVALQRPIQKAAGIAMDATNVTFLVLTDSGYLAPMNGVGAMTWTGTLQDESNRALFGISDSAGPSSQISVYVLGTGAVRLTFAGETAIESAASAVSPGATIYTIAVNVTATDYSLFLDGVLIGTETFIGTKPTALNTCIIGGRSLNGVGGSVSPATCNSFAIT